MPDGIKLTVDTMTARDWAMLKESLPALKDGGNPFEWSLKLLAYCGGAHDAEHGKRVSRKVWRALSGGPRTFGPFRIQRAGRNRIAFVCTEAWARFRSSPRPARRGPRRTGLDDAFERDLDRRFAAALAGRGAHYGAP